MSSCSTDSGAAGETVAAEEFVDAPAVVVVLFGVVMLMWLAAEPDEAVMDAAEVPELTANDGFFSV